jgi:hypothetical protein
VTSGMRRPDGSYPELAEGMRASRAFSAIVAASVVHAGDVVTRRSCALVLVAIPPDVNAAAIASTLDIHPG